MKNKLKQQRINVVFNESNITLTESMEKVLNRGLKFAILPLQLDIIQVLTEFKYFERTLMWKEFWFGRDAEESHTEPIFKQKKNNFPKNHKAPQGLKDFVSAVKSDIMDPKNRNKVQSNLPDDEKEALKILIKLQKDRKIVIKPCDKGAGIIILNFDDYINACEDHLNSKTPTGEDYYKEINLTDIEKAKEKISDILKEAFDNEYISENEYKLMLPDTDAILARFYALFKVHKPYEQGSAPDVRPIVSCSGSMMENIAIFVENFIKSHGTSHESYLQDTPDFLRFIDKINKEIMLSKEAMLVVIDVIGLYNNIPHNEGVNCVEKILEQDHSSNVPNGLICRLLELLLKYSFFEFNDKLYQQRVGTSMGSKPAPAYANIFMAETIDKLFWDIARKYGKNGEIPLKFFKRFLDDIFLIFFGSVHNLHMFFDELNTIHPTIKFTMSHTVPENNILELESCSCPPSKSISYLDTLCEIKEGKIITDLYRKPTDKNQYLLTSSCHPIDCFKSIPFSLAMRIVRICSEIQARDNRLQELKEMLLSRGYTPGIIDAAIAKARAIPRQEALKRVTRHTDNQRPKFVVSYDPRLPSISSITQRHWRSMVSQDPYLKSVFPSPPLIAYKRQKNIRESLIKAKVYPQHTRDKRYIPGMKKCGKCLICNYIKEGKFILGRSFTWKIVKSLSCDSFNVVYMIDCQKERCRQRYIGVTQRSFRKRVNEHIGYVKNKKISEATGEHFNLPGHSHTDMKFTIIEQVKSLDPVYAREREKLHIKKFNTYHKGINKQE